MPSVCTTLYFFVGSHNRQSLFHYDFCPSHPSLFFCVHVRHYFCKGEGSSSGASSRLFFRGGGKEKCLFLFVWCKILFANILSNSVAKFYSEHIDISTKMIYKSLIKVKPHQKLAVSIQKPSEHNFCLNI